MPLLGLILTSLHGDAYIEGVLTAQCDYPVVVTGVAAAGRTFAGVISDLPVRRQDGSVVPMSVELDREITDLLRQGFEVESASLDEDGRFSISVVGNVTDENVDFLRGLAEEGPGAGAEENPGRTS